MVGKIIGKILDEDNVSIPSATVYLSDSNGNLINQTSKVKADLDGNYTLVVPSINSGANISVLAGGYPSKTIPISADLYSKSPNETATINVVMEIRSQLLPEFTLSGKDAYECYRKGGTWDEVNKTCTKRSWLGKNKWWLFGAGILLASITTYLVVKNNKK